MDIKHKIARAASGEERQARGRADPRFVLEQLKDEYTKATKLRLVKMEKDATEMKKAINRQVYNIKMMKSRVDTKPPLPTTPQMKGKSGTKADTVEALTQKMRSHQAIIAG